MRQPRADSNWLSIKFKLQFKGNCSDVARADLIDFQLNSNWKLKDTDVRQPRADSNWFSTKFELKLQGNCSDVAIADSNWFSIKL